jgi:hypothetical protein
MAQSTPLFVGLDVHTDSIAVAHATGGRTDPPVFVGEIGTRQADLDRLIRRLQGKAPALRVVYEAGPCGYGLHRYMWAIACAMPTRAQPLARGGGGTGTTDRGVTLERVKRRLRSTLVPRPRQAPDGPQYGGTQSTEGMSQ